MPIVFGSDTLGDYGFVRTRAEGLRNATDAGAQGGLFFRHGGDRIRAYLVRAGRVGGAGARPFTQPTGPTVAVQLNKLQEVGEGQSRVCRLWFELMNRGVENYLAFEVELVIFDAERTIHSRLAVEFAPLLGNKMRVGLVDLPDLPCEMIGRVLINDVFTCEIEGQGSVEGCLRRIDLRPSKNTPELL